MWLIASILLFAAFAANVVIGASTGSPLGLNLFVVSGITGESILKIAARAVPFVFFMLIVVLMIADIPAISTTLLPDIYK